MASLSDLQKELTSLSLRSPSPCTRDASTKETSSLGDHGQKQASSSPDLGMPSSQPPQHTQTFTKTVPSILMDDDDGECDIVQPHDPGQLGSAAAASLSIPDMLANIKRTAISKCRPVRKTHPPMENVCLVGPTTGRIKWIQPSGPRRPGEGTEDDVQGIVDVQETSTGGILLRITLLASGFVIGPSGYTIREIIKETGADVKSWTDKVEDDLTRPTRTFIIEGHPESVAIALRIICDGIARYKELCEGHFVSRLQIIHGIPFSYQPPPRTIVPHAAGLKGQGTRVRAACGGGSGRMRLPHHGSSATQTAVRILADVKNCLSAQSAMKAAAAAQDGGTNNVGRPPSPGMQRMHHSYSGGHGRIIVPHTPASPEPPEIPPGFAMIAPNLLVPISALQSSYSPAPNPKQPPAYANVPPRMQDAIMMDCYAGYSSMEQPSYFSNQGTFVDSFAPVTPMVNNMGQGTGGPMSREYHSPYDTTPGMGPQWGAEVEGDIAYAGLSRGSTPRSTLEHRSFVEVPVATDAPFREFYDQLLRENTPPPTGYGTPVAAGGQPIFAQTQQTDAPTPTFGAPIYSQAFGATQTSSAHMSAAMKAGSGQLSSPDPPSWQHSTSSPFGVLPTASSPPASGWPGSKAAGSALPNRHARRSSQPLWGRKSIVHS
ncbi:g6189 [Coccomyxa elongata]